MLVKSKVRPAYVPLKIRPVPTRTAWLIASGDQVTINVADFDPAIHSETDPKAKKTKKGADAKSGADSDDKTEA